MSVNPAEQLLEGKVTGEIRRTRTDLDQLKNKQRIGSLSQIAQFGAEAAFGGISIAAGDKIVFSAAVLAVRPVILVLAIAAYIDTDNDNNYLCNYGGSLNADQWKVNYSVIFNHRIPADPLLSAWPATQYWTIAVTNDGASAHTVYLKGKQLFPVGTGS